MGDLQAKGGTGVLSALNLESHPALLCSIHTFIKAAGCHGAILLSSNHIPPVPALHNTQVLMQPQNVTNGAPNGYNHSASV